MASTAEHPKDDVSPHYVRITSGGKIRSWVDFSLKSFREKPGRPLILHTLPSNPPPGMIIPSTGPPPVTDSFSTSTEEPDKSNSTEVNGGTKDHSISTSARNIPKLISVVEIIKREYFKELSPGAQSAGLYQYNYLGFVEGFALDPGSEIDVDEVQRQKHIMAVLEGKNHLKQEKTPYMRVTLCTYPLPELGSQATCQLPLTKRLSRSAKARQRRRNLRESGTVGKDD